MSKQDLPSEFELIARYFAPLACALPGAYGLLDDAAVINPASRNELVVKTDTIVGGTDFLPDEPAILSRAKRCASISPISPPRVRSRAYPGTKAQTIAQDPSAFAATDPPLLSSEDRRWPTRISSRRVHIVRANYYSCARGDFFPIA
jgi:hypothetical protein